MLLINSSLICDYNLGLIRVLRRRRISESPLNNLFLPLCFMYSSKSWEFAVQVMGVHILIGFDIPIINESFMLCHELAVPFLFLSLHDLASQSVNILVVSLLELLVPDIILHLTLGHLLLDDVGEGFILESLKTALLLLLLHLLS